MCYVIHNLHNNNRYRNAAYHKIEIHIFDVLGGLRRLSRSERLNIAASAECKRSYRSSHALGKLSEKRIKRIKRAFVAAARLFVLIIDAVNHNRPYNDVENSIACIKEHKPYYPYGHGGRRVGRKRKQTHDYARNKADSRSYNDKLLLSDFSRYFSDQRHHKQERKIGHDVHKRKNIRVMKIGLENNCVC